MGLVKLLTDPGQFTFYKGKGYQYKPREIPYGNDRPGGGSSKAPLVTTPLPDVESDPTSKTNIDSLYRGQGVLSQAVLDDTQRITKFLATEQGLRFIATQNALLLKDNIARYGNNVLQYQFFNPIQLIAQTALSATGEHLKQEITFGLKPSFTRESKFGEFEANWKKKNAPTLGTDRITTSPMYINTERKTGDGYNDTVDLYFTKINNDGTGNNTYIHFRSYISGLSDNYGADWKSFRYMGRGEDFFKYNGFNRDLSFDFQVPVFSQLEQSSVYSKLNYMASCMAPDYTKGGFMRGNLFKLTIGDYLIDVPGIITGLSLNFDDNAGWDIGTFDINGNRIEGGKTGIDIEGNSVSGSWVMPKLISVGGFKFKPIHNFIPQTIQESFIATGDGKENNAPFISFGKQGETTSNTGGYNPPVDPLTAVKFNAAQKK